MASEVYIGFGSNQGDRLDNIRKAIHACAGLLQHIQFSNLYESPPWGYESQSNYLNGVLTGTTELAPQNLLNELLVIENELGRVRAELGYTDRPIDLDILDYENMAIQDDNLTLPHPMIAKRKFVLIPWAELSPNHRIAGSDITIAQMAERSADQSEIKYWGTID